MPSECAIFHSNRYHAGETCEYCSGIIRHESWGIIRKATVRYAFEITIDPSRLQLADRLILHALGWNGSPTNAKGRAPPDRAPH